MSEEIKYSEPEVREKSSGYFIGFVISVFVACLFIFLAIITLYLFDFTDAQKMLFVGILILIYLIISPLLVRTKKIREVKVYETRIIEKPVEKKVVVRKNVYIKKTKKLNIPKFDYVGSTQTKIFHKRNCKLGKLIKNKYKEHSNTESFFKKRGYRKCKMCMKK
ncbi:MAG: hypothetical protein QW117_02270 [Candidatus Pacearchaeota archaeon]